MVEVFDTHARDREVIATARDAARLVALTNQVGATGWVGDLTDHAWLASQVATLGRLDELVHVAAVGTHLAPEFATADDFRAQLEINLIAPAELTRPCLPLLRAARRSVVFIGSGASTRPVPGSAVYPATKHALKAYADVLRLDESRNGVRVATVAPGPTATAMYEKSQREAGRPYELERLISPESVARAVRFVLDASDDVHLTDVAVRPRQELV